MKRRTLGALLLTAATASGGAGCSSNAQPGQVIAGQVALSTFPTKPDHLRLVQGSDNVALAPVSADGLFSIEVPPGKGYRLQVVTGDAATNVVAPHAGNVFSMSFDVNGAGAIFDTGALRFVHNVGTRQFLFSKSCEGGGDRVCVDDSGESDQTCSAPTGDHAASDEAAAHAGDGAVAEHNVPAAFGCEKSEGAGGEGGAGGEHGGAGGGAGGGAAGAGGDHGGAGGGAGGSGGDHGGAAGGAGGEGGGAGGSGGDHGGAGGGAGGEGGGAGGSGGDHGEAGGGAGGEGGGAGGGSSGAGGEGGAGGAAGGGDHP